MCTLRVCTSPRHGVVLFVSSYPRLRSLRSLSLGLLISQPLRGCKSLLRMKDGDNPHPYLDSIGFRGECNMRLTTDVYPFSAGFGRLQGAALVAVRQKMHIKFLRTTSNDTFLYV